MNREHTLHGQVALVTGSGRGIGRAIALALAQAGAIVAAVARSSTELDETVDIIARGGGSARAFAADVTHSHRIRRVIEEVERSLGPIRLLVNNAGIAGPIGPFWEVDLRATWQAVNVNLRGPMLCTHAVLPYMVERGEGRIVNIATSAYPIPYFAPYMTSKTALIRFTEIVAEEVRRHGISMFAVGPGTVRTRLSERSLNSAEGLRWLPWFRRIFHEGLDVSEQRPAQLVLELASGSADRLSGRYLTIADDVAALVDDIARIEREQLYSLRVGTLQTGVPATRGAAIRADAERAHGLTLQLEHVFAAAAADVFKALIEPQAVEQWFVHRADVHWTCAAEMKARPGGHYRWSVTSNVAERDIFEFFGTYLTIAAPHELAFTWDWLSLPIPGVNGAGNTLVTIALTDDGHAARLTLSQHGFASETALEAHRRGWQRCLDGIAEVLRS